MKFSKLSQLFLVSFLGLFVAALLTACDIVTVDYVYVASSALSGTSTNGVIDIYAVDSGSGAMRTDVASVSTGGVAPVSMAVTSDYAHLYVAHAGSKSIVHFTIGLDGGLTQKDSVTLSATPVAIAVNTAGTFLYVASGTGSATLTEYALSSGTIGSAATVSAPLTVPGFAGDTIIPTGITVLANNAAVYVTAYDQSAYNPGGSTTSTANPGWVFGYAVGSGGALTAATNSPYQAGVKPSALAAEPTNRYLYVTDYASSQLIGYAILDGSTLRFLTNGPFKTGNEPAAIVIDPRGKFIYLTNQLDNTVGAYSIDLPTGTPTTVVNVLGSQLNTTETQPVAIVVDPALGRFVYTANHLDNSVSGFVLDPTAGSLKATQASPYPVTGTKPTAIVAIPHGNHAIQTVN
ncbi:MAG TPA: beta-propeller fold lactonase family protein [Polyangia bacterium]